MADWTATRARKAGHLRIALEIDGELDTRDVRAGFERVHFIPNALPDIDLSAIETSTTIFGRRLGAPVLISSMTGGTDRAGAINRVLADVAQRHRLAMGLGSGRVLLENRRLLPTFDVRPYAPDILLVANLGAVQLNRGITVDDCRSLVEDLSADSLMLHLNPLQSPVATRHSAACCRESRFSPPPSRCRWSSRKSASGWRRMLSAACSTPGSLPSMSRA
jgi:isopentenyl-diphosphate Delta-isomerase